ncbi:MAG: hypothetical protein U0Q22_08670 [Acidimicrobiales bacterium]
MKRVLTVATAFVLVGTCLWAGTASSQETTTIPDTTTTEAPATTVAPTTEAPTTTVADTVPDTTTTVPDTVPTTTAPAEPVVLPGQHVTSGTLAIDIRFADTPASNCIKSFDLAGGEMNIALNDQGGIGGVYGLTPSGSGSAGLFMVGLGAIPAGVGIISVSDGDCEFDAVGIGNYASDGGWARINGVGAGVHPGNYDTGEYVNMFLVDAKINSAAAPATLDMNYVKDFLLRARPGLTLPAAP